MATIELLEPHDLAAFENKFLLLESKLDKISEVLQHLKVSKTSGLLSRKEACKYLKISSVTLWELTKEGALPCKRIKSKVLYLKSDLDSFILNDCA